MANGYILALVTVCFGFATVVKSAPAGPLPSPYQEQCPVGGPSLYPPPDSTKNKWYTINLDDPPSARWQKLAADYKEEILDLIGVIKDLTRPFFNGSLIAMVDKYMGPWDTKLKAPYGDEIKGMAETVGIPVGELVFYNIFYEIFSVCTSIVASDAQGNMFHARNLDFGLFMGWDYSTHNWMVTQKLRKMIVNLDFTKNGQTLYKTVAFAGYIGVLTGMKPNAFTLTLNERFDLLNGGYNGIIDFIMGEPTNFATFFTREIMEECTSYDEALQRVYNTPMASPAYIILGGTTPSQGAVLTRSLESVLYNNSLPGTWYLLQTNYDPWQPPLFLDDRRTPGHECMNQLGQQNVGFEGLFTVLSGKTNLNKLTAYTALMEVKSGKIESYIRECPDPCWPF
jgi:acid ceramidase